MSVASSKNYEFEQYVNNHKKQSENLLLQCTSNEISNLTNRNILFNGTYKLLNHQIKSKPHIDDLIKHKKNQNIYQSVQIHSEKFPTQKVSLNELCKENSNQFPIERKIITLNKLKQITKQRYSNDKLDKKIKQIRLGGKHKEINLYTAKTEDKQNNSQLTKNQITTEQSKGIKDLKMRHNQSIQSKSLEKKFNIEKSIERFKLLKTLTTEDIQDKCNLDSNLKQGKRQIKSFKVLTNCELKKNQQNVSININTCKTQSFQNKQNQIILSNQSNFLQKQAKVQSKPNNQLLVLQKRQIKIVTSKKFNKKINQSKQNLLKNQITHSKFDQINRFNLKTLPN